MIWREMKIASRLAGGTSYRGFELPGVDCIFICLLHVNEGSMCTCTLSFTTKFKPNASSKTSACKNRCFSSLIVKTSVFTGYKNMLIKNICFDLLLGSKSRASDWSEALWYVCVYLLCKTNYAPIFCWFESSIINYTYRALFECVLPQSYLGSNYSVHAVYCKPLEDSVIHASVMAALFFILLWETKYH